MLDTIDRPRTDHDTKEAQDHSEGYVSRVLENQAAKVSSDVWLFAAIGSMAIALALRLNERKDESLFVGQWAAPLLLIGVYNKLVKIAGSDRVTR